MDRLISIKQSEGNSLLNNASLSSELGYETAQDDSVSSLYYSMNEDTITNIDDFDSPNSPGQLETEIDSGTVLVNQANQNRDTSTSTETGVESSTQTGAECSIVEPIQSAYHSHQPIVSSSSDNVAGNEVEPDPDIFSMDRQSLDDELDIVGLDAINTAQNMICHLPTNDITNFAGISTVVQELHVVRVTQQQTTKAPELGRAARRATVRFQECDLPRRYDMTRRNEMSRRSEIPQRSDASRQTIFSMSRRNQVETNAVAKPTSTQSSSRRTLMERNVETKVESSGKTAYVCEICKKSFPLRSTLIVHKNSHRTDCKYCDRTFKKALALSIHLKENCEKIPLAVRRKILTKEFTNVSSNV